jgi:hypothetical protein
VLQLRQQLYAELTPTETVQEASAP